VTPNPSLERTSTGMALGPRGVVVHHPPRGPSASPVPAAQLKLQGLPRSSSNMWPWRVAKQLARMTSI